MDDCSRLFYLSLLPCKLAVIQVGVETICCQQLFVSTLLNDIAVIHYQDAVSISDSGQTVSNDKACSAIHQIRHSLLDLRFSSCIDR